MGTVELGARAPTPNGQGFLTRLPEIFFRYQWGLFIGLGILQLVPIWSVHYFATLDGPLHVSNMLTYLRLDEPGYEVLRTLYRPAHNIAPNYFVYAFFYGSLQFFSPLVSENCFCPSTFCRFRWLFAMPLALWVGMLPCSRSSAFRWPIRRCFFLAFTTLPSPWSRS